LTVVASRLAPALSKRLQAGDPILTLVGIVSTIVVMLMLGQVLVLLLSSFRKELLLDPGKFTPANFAYIFGHPLFGQTIRNTLVLGVGTIGVMLLFAVPFAWLYTRTDLPRKDLLLTLLTVKIAIPSFLVAMGYIFLFNPTNGVGNQLVQDAFGLPAAPFDIYGIDWMIWLQGVALASPAFFMIVPTFQAIDAALEEAAWVSGIRRSTVLLRVMTPLAAPALIATGIYYFIIAVESFDYPSMLGLPVRTYVISTWLYQMIHESSDVPRYGEAAALGILTALGAVLLTLLYLWLTRQASRYVVVTGKRRQQQTTQLGPRGKIVAWLFILAYSLFGLFVPLGMLLWSSLLPYLQVPSIAALQTVTLAAYSEAFLMLPQLLQNTLTVMLVVPTISVIFAGCIAWVSTRTQLRGRRSLDLVVMISVAVPSIVGALAFLYLGLSIYQIVPLYTTIWLIILAMATRYTTWANRTISSAMLQIHRELEEVGSTSGLSRGRIFLSILLPTVGQALLFSWFWVALLSLRELTIPVMLARPENEVMATAIWGLNNSGNPSIASAMGIILVTIIGAMVMLFHRVAGGRAV
jgi:iron(III) transport system permease protein